MGCELDYGMVWCGMVWYGVVWCGVVRALGFDNTGIAIDDWGWNGDII